MSRASGYTSGLGWLASRGAYLAAERTCPGRWASSRLSVQRVRDWMPSSSSSAGGQLQVDVAVTVDCNLFRGKTHVNPISRLLEPIANAIEHGRAPRVDVVVERLQGSMAFSVTEHGGAGMSPLDCEEAIRFGHHAAKADAQALQNYSHNGIGTKACLNFFSKLAIFSVRRPQRKKEEATFVLLLLDVPTSSATDTASPRGGSSGPPPAPARGRTGAPRAAGARATRSWLRRSAARWSSSRQRRGT